MQKKKGKKKSRTATRKKSAIAITIIFLWEENSTATVLLGLRKKDDRIGISAKVQNFTEHTANTIRMLKLHKKMKTTVTTEKKKKLKSVFLFFATSNNKETRMQNIWI